MVASWVVYLRAALSAVRGSWVFAISRAIASASPVSQLPHHHAVPCGIPASADILPSRNANQGPAGGKSWRSLAKCLSLGTQAAWYRIVTKEKREEFHPATCHSPAVGGNPGSPHLIGPRQSSRERATGRTLPCGGWPRGAQKPASWKPRSAGAKMPGMQASGPLALVPRRADAVCRRIRAMEMLLAERWSLADPHEPHSLGVRWQCRLALR